MPTPRRIFSSGLLSLRTLAVPAIDPVAWNTRSSTSVWPGLARTLPPPRISAIQIWRGACRHSISAWRIRPSREPARRPGAWWWYCALWPPLRDPMRHCPFVLAREIGHVVAQHHEENTGTSLIVSLIATLLAPVTEVLKVLASVYSGATAAAASASVTAASFASSKVLVASYRPRQLDEADRIALALLGATGVGAREVATGFSQAILQAQDDQWILDLRRSIEGLTASARNASAASPAPL
ncbi:MAG: hypothetical protein EXR28_05240 [Betaproteobacteria bacterium]|nr:hypothetical protein [Betaproteobacteria bacterium]